MSELYNIYCDESCHLQNDRQTAMVLGALWCPRSTVPTLHESIAAIKRKHHLSRFFELKWTKVSSGKLDFYKELIDLFFDSDNLNFRAWVIPDKSKLRHKDFQQSHNDWYYKMYFYLLRNIIRSGSEYHIYIDIKDTQGRAKLKKLHEVLATAHYDFNRDIITNMQHVRSHDIGLLQLADLLIGAISYKARKCSTSSAKIAIVDHVKFRSGRTLEQNTLPTEVKFNLCFWEPDKGAQ